MHLLLLSGFLGSGKTTFLIRVARRAAEAGARSAVVVNEIGEIGIDDHLMRRLGLNVWELASGCICCTLSADLGTTLRLLDEQYRPDLVLLEPSGAADPRNIGPLVSNYGGRPLQSITTATLVDPLRIEALFDVLQPLITAQIQAADVILVSKADVAAPEQTAAARRIAGELNSSARLFSLSVETPLSAEIVRELMPWLAD